MLMVECWAVYKILTRIYIHRSGQLANEVLFFLFELEKLMEMNVDESELYL